MNSHFFYMDGKGLRCEFDNWKKTRTRLKLGVKTEWYLSMNLDVVVGRLREAFN